MEDGLPTMIRVLIVDDIPETRENLKKLLYFEPDIEVVGTANSGEDAVEQSRELLPDIVLMDINMPGLDGISAGELIAEEVPSAQIIMMSVQGEADYLRRSMLAGAREFLIKPFSSEELVATIRRVYELGGSRRRAVETQPPPAPNEGERTSTPPSRRTEGKIVTVFAPKGGVGCSTVALNLAVAMRQELPDSKVLLVDGNLQFGGLDVLLNLQSPRTMVDLIEQVSEIDAELVNSVVSSHLSGIKVLLAPPRPEMADLVKPDELGHMLRELRKLFDLIVIDTRSALHDTELVMLESADRIVLLTTQEIPAIKNAKLFFDVAAALEYPEDRTILVVNRSDRRTGIRAEDIESGIKHAVDGAIALDERAATQAANQGVPLVLAYRNSPAAQDILELARHVLSDLKPKAAPTPAVQKSNEEVQRPGGLFSKLFR